MIAWFMGLGRSGRILRSIVIIGQGGAAKIGKPDEQRDAPEILDSLLIYVMTQYLKSALRLM
jgi:hypothetical protein